MAQRFISLGAGESGVGAAILAKKLGYEVFVSDSGSIKPEYVQLLLDYGIEFEEKGHSEQRILRADLVMKSPGIPEKVPLIKLLQKKGVPVISEIEFAGRYSKAKHICITGSNGKTTTTMLLHHILTQAGLKVGLAGNVGQSFARQVAESDFELYVLEISSFQLDGMYDFRADIAILMNITPDHLDRYEYDFQKYIDSKLRLIQNMTPDDYFIYCGDDPVIRKQLAGREILPHRLPFGFDAVYNPGAWVEEDQLNIVINNNPFNMSIFDLSLQGRHNAYNSMASGIASRVLDIRKETIRESLSDFQGVEHRLEPVIKVHGIEFVNDSKATNVNSSWYALETMKTKVVWIVGGVDKGNDYTMLYPLLREKVKAIVCLGTDNTRIHDSFYKLIDTIVDTNNMEEAVRTAFYLAEQGDTVLLSPACASFDLFENYEDRGRQFKTAVRNL
ncbi:MAG: UDP-N-acetylmuramoyl-L-alanine--D-glutamate ligase [Bacteroidales bacterium]|jgi:UDP-N-acetylmuramoylalanine--D-glutamate ligase|nr:UDP-N-acetylmuramoyl-L-alanine--D-glutamate ligase [Bacteroidales bacterium]MDD2569577.1 UDP-N-acetylmuramoyl-L-alanine--D-glutamate ligase [Bacteroidales bacterium]MDD2812873.1 UDP-N-acetylmuramoyl-L-alanine--D-glutamate ligase [Bacteroidales bacterium]MDD3385676.1 UDP-N-acetylmuramoyl-L-alanine--D-glutamate ligase [Bacteroidales bacterium]MDD3812081.1 UDP-N-acetylmuramoyl-L-alanine--D-glutamate ligase [Bacteroidales bacterium]